MITLHESNITTFPLNNGIGVLRDVIRAYAEEELNGMFEFYMEYDSEGHLVDELKEERIIKAKAQDKLGYQLFRIYSITKNHENDNLIVRGQHVTYDLANNFVESLEARNLTKKQVMEKIGSSTAYPHPFNMTSSNTTTQSSTSLYRTNPLQMVGGMVGSVLQIWGGQIERDNFNLILHDRRGSDDGVKVTYEKNITGLEATFDISGLVTRIFPFVYLEATDDEPERLITVSGKYIDSPHINDYEKIYIEPIDYSSDERINTDGTDAQIRQQLTDIASQYFKDTGNDKIKVDMEVKFEHLWETEEYKDLAVLELVGMGDTVTINHSKLKVDVTAIVKYIRYDCIAEKNEEVRLGSVKAKLTDSVNRVVDVAEKVEQAQQTANQAIRAANGKNTIYYGPDEPEGGIEGDLWFRVVDGEYTRTYRHDGIQWQLVVDMDTSLAKQEAQQAKDDAQSAVDRANQATQQATDAINQAQTAFDEAQAALGTANNAMTQANSAFSLANDAFNEVESLSEMVDENTGEISTIKQSVIGLQTQVSDNAGNISSLTQIAQGLQTQVTDIEGNVSTLQQTAQGLQSSVTNLQDELDGLEIGGRNYALNSDELVEYKSNARFPYDVSDEIKNHPQTQFSVSFDMEYTGAEDISRVEIYFYNGRFLSYRDGASSGNRENTPIGGLKNNGDWARYEGTIYTVDDIGNENNITIVVRVRKAGGGFSSEVRVKNIKVEKGNKATDWTPAPEDIDHQFSVITQTIDSITTRVGDAEGNITTLQQTSSSLAARLTDAEGNITTLTATVSGLQTTVSNIEGDVSSVTQLANALQVRMTDAEGNISTLTQTTSSLQSTIKSVRDDLDGLDISGRNLIKNSDFGNEDNYQHWVPISNVYFSSTAPREYDGLPYKFARLSVSAEPVGNNNRVRTPYNINLVNGQTYTLSWVAALSSYLSSEFNYTGILRDGIFSINLSSRIKRTSLGIYNIEGNRTLYKYEATFTHNDDTGKYAVMFGTKTVTESGAFFVISEPMLVEGNKSMEWSPAPEDMATQSQISQLSHAINLRVEKDDIINQINISTESILISGKKLILDGDTTVTGDFKVGNANITSLDAGKLTSGTLDAGKISVINLSANSIVGGILQSQNSNTTFNLNTGNVSMENATLTLGGGATIKFTDAGNKITYSILGPNTYYRTAGMGVGRVLGNDLPFAYLGTTPGGDLNTLDSDYSGLMVHTTYHIRNNGAANSISGGRFSLRNRAVGWDKGVTFDFYGDPTISLINGSTEDYTIGPLYKIVGKQSFNVQNYYNGRSGWFIETNYAGDGTAINIRGQYPTEYNYSIGTGSRPIDFIYVKSLIERDNSDIRLKQDIDDNPLGLDFINSLETIEFRFKLSNADIEQGIKQHKKQFGLIAQQVRDELIARNVDVEEYALIDKPEEDGYYSLQYQQLITPTIKAVQELDLKVESVKDDVEWLKLENQYLKQKVKQLEEMIA